MGRGLRATTPRPTMAITPITTTTIETPTITTGILTTREAGAIGVGQTTGMGMVGQTTIIPPGMGVADGFGNLDPTPQTTTTTMDRLNNPPALLMKPQLPIGLLTIKVR